MGYLVWGLALVVMLECGCGSPELTIRMDGDNIVVVVPTRRPSLPTATVPTGQVATLRAASHPLPKVIVSPDVATDGIVFRLDDFRLSRSGDGGRTWRPIDI